MPNPSNGARRIALALVALLLVAPAGVAVGGAAHVLHTAGGFALRHSGPARSSASSTNWAGWAVTGGSKSVSFVKASWIVPKIQGSCPSGAYQYSSMWVGIDGYSSSTVEQTGTDSDCQGGSATYYAWYEFYPNPSRLISTMTIHPGDYISAQVKFASGKFTVTITDLNTSASFHKTASVSAARTSAEWIAEAPSSGRGILPLADFGTVHFGHDATGVASTNDATVSGTTAAIGSFSSAVSITMVNQAGTANKATTSSLTPNGTSFNVTWQSAGP